MEYHTDRQARFEFKCDPSNSMLIGPDGCHYEAESEAMYFGLKASCGCGNPSGVHDFLIQCLRQFEVDTWPKPGVDGIKKIIMEDPDIAAEFIAHYLSGENFMEHGGSVYGSWLTDRGRQFIEVGPMKDDDE